MLAVPALSFICGFDDKHSHATAIAVILPLCLVSTIVYALRGSFELAIVAPTVIGVALGGIAGALLLKKLSNDVISFLFNGYWAEFSQEWEWAAARSRCPYSCL